MLAGVVTLAVLVPSTRKSPARNWARVMVTRSSAAVGVTVIFGDSALSVPAALRVRMPNWYAVPPVRFGIDMVVAGAATSRGVPIAVPVAL